MNKNLGKKSFIGDNTAGLRGVCGFICANICRVHSNHACNCPKIGVGKANERTAKENNIRRTQTVGSGMDQ